MINLKDIRGEFSGVGDPELTLLLNSTISMFEKLTRRKWKHRTDYEVIRKVDDVDCKTLFVNLVPIESLAVYRRAVGESTFEEVDSTEYTYNAERGSITNILTTWSGEIKFVVTGGMTAEKMMEEFPEVIQAIIVQMKYQRERFNSNNLILNSHSVENKSTSFIRGSYHPLFEQVCKMPSIKRHV